MALYLCLKDVINKRPVIGNPYIDEDFCPELVRYVEFYTFHKGYTYHGVSANHPETREKGVMFQNHRGERHFISATFLKEHFKEVQDGC